MTFNTYFILIETIEFILSTFISIAYTINTRCIISKNQKPLCSNTKFPDFSHYI